MALTWLHVDGKYIKNEAGQTVFLRGAAFQDLVDLPYWNGGFDLLVNRINQYVTLSNGKANVIRCPMGLAGWAPHNVHPEVYDKGVDDLVALAAQNNIHVVLNFISGIRYSSFGDAEELRLALDPTDWINWLLHWVNRYKNDPTVAGIEIWNEPYAGAFGGGEDPASIALGVQRWINMATQAVEAIHQANPSLLIIVASCDPSMGRRSRLLDTAPICTAI